MRDQLAAWLRGGPLSQILWRPWYDRVSLPLVTSLIFPLSRAWAAADAACADAEDYDRDPQAAFLSAVGGEARSEAPSAPTLALFARGRRGYREAEAALEASLFARAAPDPAELAERAAVRDRRAVQYMAQRTLFGLQHLRERFPAVRFSVDAPDAVARAQAQRLAAPGTAFAIPPEPPRLRLSHAIEGESYRRFYLRADGPADASDQAPGPLRAVVLEPPGPEPPRGAVVLAHGVCMEEDYWGGYSTLTHWLLEAGFAVVLPEGPWHGRRRPAGRCGGRYGGEVVVARGPAGLIGYFAAHVPEIGRLTAWARARWERPVGLVGVSLGALTGQLVLAHAGGWEAAARPDAALLVAPTDSVERTVFEGSLTQGMGATGALAFAGWTRGRIEALAPLYEPPGDAVPALDPARILVALGREDEVVPYATGLGRCDAWRIPPRNRFVRRQGHFALSLGLPAQPAPLERLAALLSA